MQTDAQERTYSGLIAILGLVALLVGLIVMILLPSIRYAAWLILLLGILLLAAAFIIDFRRVSRAIRGKRGRFSTGSTVMVSIFIGIILLVNAISIGSYYRFDLSGVAQFTLTSQTKDVLSKLETPVEALLFFTPDDPYGIASYAASLLSEYRNYTNKLSLKIIDPDEQPDQARQYGITQYQSVVFESQNHRRLVSPSDIVQFDDSGRITGLEAEHAFTSAILEVSGTVQKKVYFLSGQGEANINADYSYVANGLRDNLYLVETLDLMATPSIPEDCTALIIAGPRKSLTGGEFDIIKRYLDSGGWVMILLNPNPPQGFNELLSPWGVNVQDGTIIDDSSYVDPSKATPIVPASRNFFALREGVYFPESTAIIPQPEYTPKAVLAEDGTLRYVVWTSEDGQIEMYSLLRTSQYSWLEKDFNPSEEPKFDDGRDLMGSLNIGFLITPSLHSESGEISPVMLDTRLVVMGDSDFASNQHFYNGNNGEFFLNSVQLLTAGKELISIERKVVPYRRLVVGPEITNFIRISSIGLLPLLVLVMAGIMWWRRR